MSTGGFTIDGRYGYTVYASIQNDTVPTTATLATGDAGFDYGRPYDFDNWYGTDMLVFVQIIGLQLESRIGNVQITGPHITSGDSNQFGDGFMLDMTRLMG